MTVSTDLCAHNMSNTCTYTHTHTHTHTHTLSDLRLESFTVFRADCSRSNMMNRPETPETTTARPVCPPVCLSVCPPVCPPVCLSVCLSVCEAGCASESGRARLSMSWRERQLGRGGVANREQPAVGGN